MIKETAGNGPVQKGPVGYWELCGFKHHSTGSKEVVFRIKVHFLSQRLSQEKYFQKSQKRKLQMEKSLQRYHPNVFLHLPRSPISTVFSFWKSSVHFDQALRRGTGSSPGQRLCGHQLKKGMPLPSCGVHFLPGFIRTLCVISPSL